MKRRLAMLLFLALATGCSAHPTPTAAPVPPPGDEEAQPKTGTPARVMAAPEEVAEFFRAAASNFGGVFVVRDGQLAFVQDDGHTESVLSGKMPSVLTVKDGRALITDGERMFWYKPGEGASMPIEELPFIRLAVWRGDTFILLAGADKQVLRWTPGQKPSAFSLPDHLFAVNEVSISPDGRYAVASFDLDPPQSQRMGAVWAYDLQTGATRKWPDPMPNVGGYGAWLLGWSGTHTLRLMSGRQGFNRGHTWNLTGSLTEAEDQNDRTEYRTMETPWPTPDGSWLLYRDMPERVVAQSIRPEAKPISVCFNHGGLYNQRILLNGHIAFASPAGWWEMLPDATFKSWGKAEVLY